jgi:hypothetical protein
MHRICCLYCLVLAVGAAGQSVAPCMLRSAVQLDRMNTLYVGVDNPVTLCVDGVDPQDYAVRAEGVQLHKSAGCGQYVIRAWQPGDARLLVSWPGHDEPIVFKYRVVRFRAQNILLGGRYGSGSSLPAGVFRAQPGLTIEAEAAGYEPYCRVAFFEVTYLPKDGDPVVLENRGSRWTPEVRALINRARPGDRYLFEEVRLRCQWDIEQRVIELSYLIH